MTDTTTHRIVDQVVDPDGERCELTRVYKIGGETVRIRVRHDGASVAESFAVAEVLAGGWTVIAYEPVSNWHAEVMFLDYADDVESGLHVVADLLYERAAAIV